MHHSKLQRTIQESLKALRLNYKVLNRKSQQAKLVVLNYWQNYEISSLLIMKSINLHTNLIKDNCRI